MARVVKPVKDNRYKTCGNEACIIHKNGRTFFAEDIYCTVCQEKLIYVCRKCRQPFDSKGPLDLTCDFCMKIREDKKQKVVGVAKGGAEMVGIAAGIVTGPAGKALGNAVPAAARVIGKAGPAAKAITGVAKVVKK